MPGSPLYLDECVDHRLAEALRKRGFTVHTALDSGMTELSDERQLSFAATHGWMIVTHNAKDFRRLHNAMRGHGEGHGGIVILPERPPLELLETRAAMLLDWIMTFPEYRSALFTWGQLQRLMEGGFRLPGYSETEVRRALGQAAL